MSAKKLYASFRYSRSSMGRQIADISHSVKALRRGGGHIFQIELHPIPGAKEAPPEIKIVGKEIPEVFERIAKFDAAPNCDFKEQVTRVTDGAVPVAIAQRFRRRYRRKIRQENAA